RLRRRGEIEHENRLLARRAQRLWAFAVADEVLEPRRRQHRDLALAQPVKLRCRGEDLVEARDVAVIHEVELALHRLRQAGNAARIGHGSFLRWMQRTMA